MKCPSPITVWLSFKLKPKNVPMLSPKVYQTIMSVSIHADEEMKKYLGEGKNELNTSGNPQNSDYSFHCYM
jgi:hypothetical protein